MFSVVSPEYDFLLERASSTLFYWREIYEQLCSQMLKLRGFQKFQSRESWKQSSSAYLRQKHPSYNQKQVKFVFLKI
jgi:hypothetical protein